MHLKRCILYINRPYYSCLSSLHYNGSAYLFEFIFSTNHYFCSYPFVVDVFNGEKNSLSIRRKYRTVYTCNFDLILYPFDVQTCEMHLRITSASKDLLTFDHLNSSVFFIPNPLLLEYEVEFENHIPYSLLFCLVSINIISVILRP